jgi:hypothetical protein
MKFLSSIAERKLLAQCRSEYFEQMLWNYQGGFHGPSQSQNGHIVDAGIAHIQGIQNSLFPMHQKFLEQYDEKSTEGKLSVIEMELLADFCSQVNIEGSLVYDWIVQDAKAFSEENFQKGETFARFESRVSKVYLDYKKRGWIWQQEVWLSWLKLSADIGRKGVGSISSRSNRQDGVIEKLNEDKIWKPQARKPNLSKGIVEIVNQEKVKKPTSITKSPKNHQRKSGNRKSAKEIDGRVKKKPVVESPYKAKSSENIIRLSDAKARRLMDFLKGELEADSIDPREIFTSVIKGWSWMCEVHGSYGIGRSEDEVLSLAGSHMYFEGEDGALCEIYTRKLSG